jgi:hypothetical protein
MSSPLCSAWWDDLKEFGRSEENVTPPLAALPYSFQQLRKGVGTTFFAVTDNNVARALGVRDSERYLLAKPSGVRTETPEIIEMRGPSPAWSEKSGPVSSQINGALYAFPA